MKPYFSFIPTAEFELRYIAALTEMDACHKIMLEGTNPLDISTGLSMGDGNGRIFCQKGFKCAAKFTNLIDEDAHFTLLDYKGNIEFDTFWYKYKAERKSVEDQKNLIEGLHGRAMMNKAHHVQDAMTPKKDLPKYKADYDDFHQYYASRAETSKSTKKNNAILSEAEKIIAANKETS
jgi:hypothetical protein